MSGLAGRRWCGKATLCSTKPDPDPDPNGDPQVALRSGVEVRRDVLGSKGRRPAPGMQTAVRDAVDRTPAAAGAVLLHMGASRVQGGAWRRDSNSRDAAGLCR